MLFITMETFTSRQNTLKCTMVCC